MNVSSQRLSCITLPSQVNANILAEEKVESKMLLRRLQREAQEVEMDAAIDEVMVCQK